MSGPPRGSRRPFRPPHHEATEGNGFYLIALASVGGNIEGALLLIQMIRAPFILLTIIIGFVAPAAASQSLIPTPYPSGVSGAAPLDPTPQHLGGPQEIIKDPYPQILGANAQGNPPIARRQRHQHLIGSINQRKYRVDRIPTYQP